jgi:hypothetical protein
LLYVPKIFNVCISGYLLLALAGIAAVGSVLSGANAIKKTYWMGRNLRTETPQSSKGRKAGRYCYKKRKVLTNFDIEDYAKSLTIKHFRGVLLADE